ncbi:hypothetical protein RchiOBHm_Chr2g0124271 [Rosa chinensis]|uniref:Uncharacterized protein n=1 Tax=Rosa chinensis TaxID=74649 RepID=A0A2P6RT99_ROSCH|nr:hypothetical protein RchiOBHm_Chr2g0124271 [Rosa chinensis]
MRSTATAHKESVSQVYYQCNQLTFAQVAFGLEDLTSAYRNIRSIKHPQYRKFLISSMTSADHLFLSGLRISLFDNKLRM